VRDGRGDVGVGGLGMVVVVAGGGEVVLTAGK